MIIKKIFEARWMEVHADFLKFGRGDYKNKYLIEAKKQKDKFVIKTDQICELPCKKGLEKAQGKLMISGVIVSTLDIEVPFSEIKSNSGNKTILS
jgi:hypothetical protein